MILKGNMGYQVDWKRFYIDIQHTEYCPKCNMKVIMDFSQNYLSYPIFNEMELYSMYCNNCEYDWDIEVTLKQIEATIEVNNGN